MIKYIIKFNNIQKYIIKIETNLKTRVYNTIYNDG
jgi:hypothetical protein